jgi:hypothetical protein
MSVLRASVGGTWTAGCCATSVWTDAIPNAQRRAAHLRLVARAFFSETAREGLEFAVWGGSEDREVLSTAGQEAGATDFAEAGATDFVEAGAADFVEAGATDFVEAGVPVFVDL